MRVTRIDAVPIETEFGPTTVRLLRCAYRPTGAATDAVVTVVFYQEDFELLAKAQSVLYRQAFDGSVDVAAAEAAQTEVGLRLLSRISPDVGVAGAASLGRRRVFIKKFLKYIAQSFRAGPPRAAWGVLENIGKSEWPDTPPSFIDWMQRVHFVEHDLPTAADVLAAERFIAKYARAIARDEQDLLHQGLAPTSQATARAPGKKAKKSMTDLDRRLRSRAQKYMRRGLVTDGVKHALTLLSYAARQELNNKVALDVLRSLPPALLDEPSRRLFNWMWVAKDGADDRGRFDLPIMSSPVCSSLLEQLGAFGAPEKKRLHEQMVDDLLAFAVDAAPRNKAVDIALGFAVLYQSWLHDERAWDREDKATKRAPSVFGLRSDEEVAIAEMADEEAA